MRKRILVTEASGFDDDALTILESEAEVDLCGRLLGGGVEDAVNTYDAIWIRLGRAMAYPDRGGATSSRCRILATPTTGLDHVNLGWCVANGIKVISLQGETQFLQHVHATAEHTLALTLALLRRLPDAHYEASAGRWNRDGFCGTEIHGKTVGIVGMGRLGRKVADLFAAFGAEVACYDPDRNAHPGVLWYSSLADLLENSDIVSLHVPLNDSTRGMIGREAMAAMQGAVLINTSRGAVIDETELLWALENGVLRGAALDVLKDESEFCMENPLAEYARGHNNLILTPHIGGNTFESRRKTERFLAAKVADACTRL